MNVTGLLGPFNTPHSQKADSQIARNLYRAAIQSDQGVNPTVTYRSPGLLPNFVDATTHETEFTVGPVRGMLNREPPSKDHAFICVFDRIYDVQESSVDFDYGPIVTDDSPVIMAESPTSLMIVSAGVLYRINGGALSVITPDIGLGVTGVCFLKNYFVILYDDLQQFGWSEDDGATFAADAVQTFEADANNGLAIVALNQLLWIIGTRITQVFSVGSNPDAPFVPIDSAVIPSGTAARYSVEPIDDALFWLERTKIGTGHVVMVTGFTAQKVSSHALENAIREYARDFGVSDAIGMSYEINGQEFYRLTFPAADHTWEYNRTLNEWYEVSWRNFLLGTNHRHRGMCMMAAFNKILVGDHTNGYVYEMSPDVYHDYGFPLYALRRTPHIIEENKEIDYDKIEIALESGVGLETNLWLQNYNMDRATFVTALADAVTATDVTADQAIVLQQIYDFVPYVPLDPYPADDVMVDLGFYPWGGVATVDDVTYGTQPMLTLRYSNDGGRTYANDLNRSLGAAGEYVKRLTWNHMGTAIDRVWEIEYSAPCKLALTAAFMEAEAYPY